MKPSCLAHVLVSLVLGTVLARTGVSLAAEDTWTYEAAMPIVTSFFGGGIIDERIYIVGGAPSNSSVISTVEMYDPTADAWTRMADMPSGRVGHATCVFDGKIYVFGGMSPDAFSTARNNVYVYDPQTDAWIQKSDMPYANGLCGIAVVGSTIYLLGGGLSQSSPPIPTVMAYDPVTDSWTQKADMPTARVGLSASVVDGKIYAIGGAKEDWRVSQYRLVEVYDPSTDTWTRKSDMPTARWGLGTCVVGGKIYAVGGWSGSDACRANEVYDPMTDTWTAKSPLQQKRNGAFVCSYGAGIYAMGGAYPVPQITYLSSVEEYDTGFRVPLPDFNGDGMVDISDLLRLIESWGQNDPAVDIAPPPFGDGVVDVLDLELLMSYWGQEIPDPTLIAHWRLDETEGVVAFDSAGTSDGVVVGNPTWQPAGGKLGGALELDGVDDCVTVEYVRDPSEGPFSVFAWVKGGGPEQVILSQNEGADWLMVAPDGALKTALKGSGRLDKSLASTVVIIDDTWHRIGLVWDGSNRILYVDDVEVARDTQSGLASSTGGLYIGTGATLAPGSFWNGLIDDVRIYNRAVKP
jgi:N-acetylneuraminic acid mutarotase